MADVVVHLSVQVDDWFEMNEDQQKAYMNEFDKISVDDAMTGKAIGSTMYLQGRCLNVTPEVMSQKGIVEENFRHCTPTPDKVGRL